LTLPIFLKLLKVEEIDDHVPFDEQKEAIHLLLAKEAVLYLDNKYSKEMADFETIRRIKEQMERSIRATEQTVAEQKQQVASVRKLYKKIMLDLTAFRRKELNKLRKTKKYDDEVLRDMENNLDLEEARFFKH